MSDQKGVVDTVTDSIKEWPLLSVCIAALVGYTAAIYHEKKAKTVAECVLENTSHDSSRVQVGSAWKACRDLYETPQQKR